MSVSGLIRDKIYSQVSDLIPAINKLAHTHLTRNKRKIDEQRTRIFYQQSSS